MHAQHSTSKQTIVQHAQPAAPAAAAAAAAAAAISSSSSRYEQNRHQGPLYQ